MMSAEAKNLERFVDNFVAPAETVVLPVSSESNYWINMSQGESNPMQSNYGQHAYMNPRSESQMPGNYPVIQSPVGNGTELWGERPGGNQWRAVALKTSLPDWQDHRPEIQSRTTGWSQSYQQHAPVQQGQEQAVSIAMQAEKFGAFHEQHNAVPNSSQIQNLVCDLIRQNNMKKPYNLPPWVDVSKPPPPLPIAPNLSAQMHCNLPGAQHNNGQYNASMQTINPQQLAFSQMQDAVSAHAYNRSSSLSGAAQQNFEYNASGDHSFSFKSAAKPPIVQHSDVDPQLPVHSLQAKVSCQQVAQEQRQAVFHNPLVHDDKDQSSVVMPSAAPDDINSTRTEGEGQKTFDIPNFNKNLPPLANVEEFATSTAKACLENNTTAKRISPDLIDLNQGDTKKELLQDSKHGYEDARSDRRIHQEKATIQSNRKKPYYRQPSAADLDLDWRRRDSEQDSNQQEGERVSKRRSQESDGRNNYHRQVSRQSSSDNDVFKPAVDSKQSQEPQRSRSKETKRMTSLRHVETGGQRHLTQMSKVKLLSLLQQNDKASEDSVGKEIRQLQISDSETDMSKFIEVTQCFATNEAKMREVAEMLCNKAINDPRYGHNVALLCDRLSHMMVHGTKFRNVILNVMQGHYKNRELLFSSSFRQDRRWFGFLTFLVELFLNLRTETRERLLVLTTPVLNCLFQVLSSEKVDQKHIDCFGCMFKLVGPALESECPERLNDLMQEIRDRCVLSKAAFVKRVLLYCVEFYSSKWESRTR